MRRVSDAHAASPGGGNPGPREPLVVGGAGFTIGALLAPLPAWLLVGAALLAIGVVVRRRARGLFVVALVAGALIATLRLPDTAPLRALAETRGGAPHPMTARVVEIPERTAAGLSMIVALEGGRARLALDAPCGAVGDTIAGELRLAPHDGAAMPAFRARSLTVQRGVAVTGGLDRCRVIERAERPRWPDTIVDPLVRALALGDRGGTAAALDAMLAAAGQQQVMALGGLAPLALAVLVALAVVRVGERKVGERKTVVRIAAAALGLALAAALLLALDATPTHLRVSALALALLVSLARPQHLTPRDALALTAAAVSAVDPAGIGDTAFQLAFATTTALVGLAPALGSRALALALGTAPLILRQFERLSPLSLLADALTLPLAALTGLAGLLTPLTEAPARAAAAALTAVLEALATHAMSPLATPTVLECVLAYVVLGLLAVRPRPRAALVVAALLLALVAGAPRVERRWLTEPRADVLPTPSGHAVLVHGAGGATVLVGLGGAHPDPDAPARMIAQVLKLRHAPRIDALVLAGEPTPAEARTLALLAQAYPVRATARAEVSDIVVEPTASAVELRVGDQRLRVETSTAASAAPLPAVLSRTDAPPLLVTGADRWPLERHGLLTLRGHPWVVHPHRPAP